MWFITMVTALSLFSRPDLTPPQLVKLAKRLKKEKVNVDIINFGEEVRFFLCQHNIMEMFGN